MYNYEILTEVVTGRKPDMFLRDIDNNLTQIRKYKRALFIGGAGTIGLATIKEFLRYGNLERIGIVDQDENAMAEAIRSVRNRAPDIGLDVRIDDVTGPWFHQWVANQSYDIVLWFAAMKHVRSERDADSCRRLVDTNYTALAAISDLIGSARLFYCSTDKAADPENLMGATKLLGENWTMNQYIGENMGGGTAARFANVAFSNGSLLQSWLYRMAENQPLAVPRNISRFLISPAESGRISLLAATWPEINIVLVPSMWQPHVLEDVCRRFAGHFKYNGGIIVTDADTSGEKEVESFAARGELSMPAGMDVNKIRPYPFYELLPDDWRLGSKEQIIAAVATTVPNFRHRETGKSLDAKV